MSMLEGAPNNNERKIPIEKILATLTMLISVYYYFFTGDIGGLPPEKYKKVEKDFKILREKYNQYKASGRESGFITAEEIDELREYFILMHAHVAQKIHEKYNIPASIILAQAIIESDAGTSKLFQLTNNPFGIKCHRHSKKKCLNKEYPNCCVQYEDDHDYDHFKKFKDLEDAFVTYVKVLKESRGENGNQRYRTCFACGDDYKCWADALQGAHYASNNEYAEMLKDMIYKYGLSVLDQPGVYFMSLEDVKKHMPVEKK